MGKLLITENEKNEILNLYKSKNIILEGRGGKVGRKLARLLGKSGMENAGKLAKDLLSGNRDYYIYSVTADGTITLRGGQYDKEEFLDFIEDFTGGIENGTISMTSKQINDLFVNLFLKNDANFTVRFITDRIEKLISSDPQFAMKIDFINDLINNSRNNDLFRAYFPVESTYFKKLSDLIESDDFIDAGPSEKVNLLKSINTQPKTLSNRDLKRLAGEQIKYAREIIELLKGFRKSTKQLKSEINDLIDSYVAGDFVNTSQYGKQILLKLNELETRANDVGKQYLKVIRANIENSGDPNLEELALTLSTLDDGKAFKALRDTAPQDIRESINAALKDMLEVLPFRKNSEGKYSLPAGISDNQFRIKFLTFMTTGQFITPKDIYNTIIKSAGSSGIKTTLRTLRNLYVRTVAGKLMFPAFNFIFWGLLEPTIAWIRDGINESDNWFWEYIKDRYGDGGKISLGIADFDRSELETWQETLDYTVNKQIKERWKADGVTGFDVDDFFVGIESMWPLALQYMWWTNSPDAPPVEDLPVTDVVSYKDNINSFKNWLKDNDIEKKTTSI
jgi:hypothetical protein